MNDFTLTEILPSDLRDFLIKSRGWTLIDEAINDGLYAFRHEQYKRRQLFFPIDDSVVDYKDCVETALDKLVDIENISLRVLLSEISEMKDDAIGFRIVNFRNENAFIPLNYAVKAINGAKDMLLSAASSALKPQIHHPKMNRQEALELIDKSRFRHTEVGSFVVKVSTPVKAMDLQTDVFPKTPFVRQATLIVNKSISQLVTAIQTDKIEQLITSVKLEEKPLLSSNICKALMSFQEKKYETDLYLNFKWASIIEKPSDVTNIIKIQKDYYSQIEDIRKELKSQENNIEDAFIGKVEALAGDFNDTYEREGDVLLDLYVEGGESIRVRANLKAEWHHLALEAYDNSKSFIQIKGNLLAGNQPRIMKDITSFEIISK